MPEPRAVGYPGGAKRGGSFVGERPAVYAGPEADWQDTVVAMARAAGWRVYHTYDSTESEPGFPDLVMVRGLRCVVAELKRTGKAPTMAQCRWLLALALVPGIESYAWDETDVETVRAVLA